MAYYPKSGKKIFTRRRWRARVTPRAKITGARSQPRLRRRKAKMTFRALWAIAGAGTALFLIILLIVIMSSPAAGGLIPRDGSLVSGSPVHIEAALRGGVNYDDVGVFVDGQDYSERSQLEASNLSLDVDLDDGEHVVEVKVGDKVDAASRFAVDNTAPVINVDGWDLRDDGVTVIRGKVEGADILMMSDKRVAVSEDGSYKVEANRYENPSVTLVAMDAAGNRREILLDTSPPPQIKGIHISIYIAADRGLFKKMVDQVMRTELNGMQIDVKDERGEVGYASQVPLAVEVGSPKTATGMDVGRVMDKCWYNDIYPIARIVCFKDPIVASKRSDLAVKSTGGGRWGDGKWLDPYSREVWDYILGLATEASRKGFKEIQLDYVRFPSDGNTDTCVFPADNGKSKEETISGFLAYLRDGLKPLGMVLSADVFGLTASPQGGMGIGQDITSMAQNLDYICPMVYPSHYNTGEYNIGNPEANPHDIVYKSLVDFQARLEGTACKLRPWLQDFSLRLTYGTAEVQAQMKACYELGINEWLLWDPNCTFTESALQPEEQ